MNLPISNEKKKICHRCVQLCGIAITELLRALNLHIEYEEGMDAMARCHLAIENATDPASPSALSEFLYIGCTMACAKSSPKESALGGAHGE